MTATFMTEVTDRNPGRNLPQKMGAKLWAPMWAMAVMAFPIGLILGIVRANALATGADASTLEALRHAGTGFMFLGFATVFAATSFAIARILGEFREGGGSVQEAVGGRIVSLRMPATGRAFLALMMVAMMTLVVTVIVHWATAAAVAAGSITLEASERTFLVVEGVRRLAVGVYLLAIALGLGTIVTVLRFQAARLRELVTG